MSAFLQPDTVKLQHLSFLVKVFIRTYYRYSDLTLNLPPESQQIKLKSAKHVHIWILSYTFSRGETSTLCHPKSLAVLLVYEKHKQNQASLSLFKLAETSNDVRHMILPFYQIMDLWAIKRGLPEHWRNDKPHHCRTQQLLSCIPHK